MYLFELYNQLIKKKQTEVSPFAPVSAWPEEWKTVTAKVYERFPLLPLPAPTLLSELDLHKAITSRRSNRTFTKTLNSQSLADLLYYSLGEHPISKPEETPRRMYASAGGRYLLEGYVLLLKPVGEYVPGVYHYDVVNHGLRLINATRPGNEVLVAATATPYLVGATGALLLTATWQRSSVKYHERTYKFALLEAGAAFQNSGLLAASLDIDAVQIGTFAEDVVEPLLGIDGQQEAFLHAMWFG